MKATAVWQLVVLYAVVLGALVFWRINGEEDARLFLLYSLPVIVAVFVSLIRGEMRKGD